MDAATKQTPRPKHAAAAGFFSWPYQSEAGGIRRVVGQGTKDGIIPLVTPSGCFCSGDAPPPIFSRPSTTHAVTRLLSLLVHRKDSAPDDWDIISAIAIPSPPSKKKMEQDPPPTTRPTPPLSSYFAPTPSPHPWAWVLIPVGIVLLVSLTAFFVHRCHRLRRRHHRPPATTVVPVVQRQSLDPPGQPGWDTVAVPPPVWGWGGARDLEGGMVGDGPPPPYSEEKVPKGKEAGEMYVGQGEGSGSGGGSGSGSGSSRVSTNEDGYDSGSERGEEREGGMSPETMLTTASGSFVEFGAGGERGGGLGAGEEVGEGSGGHGADGGDERGGSGDVGRDGGGSGGEGTGTGTAAALPR